MKSDVIFLQETHSKIETENQWEREWGGKLLSSHGSSNSRGVAIFFRNGFDISIDSSETDQQGRFLVVKENIEDNMFILANIYAPNSKPFSLSLQPLTAFAELRYSRRDFAKIEGRKTEKRKVGRVAEGKMGGLKKTF